MSLPIINVAVDFENNGTWTDVSAYFKSATIKRGSSRVESPIIRYEPGICTMVLDNSDRRFDPTNEAGPYTVPGSGSGSGIQQAQSTDVMTYGHGLTIAVTSTDPTVIAASLRDSTVTASASTSFTVTKPTGTVSGDILVAIQSGDWGAATSMGNPTGGASWGSAFISLTQGTNTLHTKAWIKTAGGAEPASYGFTQASSSDGVAMVLCIRDAANVHVEDTETNNATAFFTTPGITPGGDADFEIRYVAGTGGGSGVTWDWSGTSDPTGTPYVEREDAQSTSFTTASAATASLEGLVVGTGGTLVKPMRPVRVRAIWNSVTYDLFRGYVDSWNISWNGPNWSEVTMPCTDAFKIFGNIERVAVAATGSGEGTGTRIGRILDGIGWSASLRDIDTGDVVVQSTTLEGNALEEMLVAAETEVGELYMTGDGKVFFRSRSGITSDSRSTTSNATFGDQVGELRYKEVTLSNDDTQLYNRIIATRVGGTVQTANDTASQDEFLLRSYERSDLIMTTDGAALNYAQYVLSLSAQPELRFENIVLQPQMDSANLFPHALNRLIGDRITVKRRPPGGGTVIDQDCFIRGIEHQIFPGDWLTTWTLQSSAAAGSFFIIGDATLGRLDRNPLGF
jgi:hypothetical protein